MSPRLPQSLKEHWNRLLLDNRHQVAETFTQQVAGHAIRNATSHATYEFFDKNGFIGLIAQFSSGNAAEDLYRTFLKQTTWNTTLFVNQVSFIWKLVAIGHLVRLWTLVTGIRPLRKNQDSSSFLTEFWMMDAEYSYLTHDESRFDKKHIDSLASRCFDRRSQAL